MPSETRRREAQKPTLVLLIGEVKESTIDLLHRRRTILVVHVDDFNFVLEAISLGGERRSVSARVLAHKELADGDEDNGANGVGGDDNWEVKDG